MSSPLASAAAVAAIFIAWFAWLFYLDKVTRSMAVTPFRSLRSWFQRPERLCGYHAASMNRPGLLVIIDMEHCEMCKHESS